MRCFFAWCLALGFGSAACVEFPQTTATSRPKPPPEIGSSITHSKACSCKACGEASCCLDLKQPDTTPKEVCGFGYDFSEQEGCGMQVESCASRCFERVWRVKLTQACDVARPPECCG